MAHVGFLVYLLSFGVSIVLGKDRISVSAPMASVEERGVLAIHCRVWNLAGDEEVTVRRTLPDGRTQRLSLNNGLVTGVSDRMFLAVRQLDDSSNVYFLSIMDVTKQDEGNYSCYIVSNFNQVAQDTVFVGVYYFPSEVYPLCSDHLQDVTVKQGDILTLNCTSEIANPPVTIAWSRTGVDTTLQSQEYINGDMKISSLTIKVKLQDHGSVFLCAVSSAMFPEETRTCHVGPLYVIPNGRFRTVPNHVIGGTQPNDVASSSVTKYTRDFDGDKLLREKCDKTCASVTSSTFFWIVSTCVSVVLAIVFGVLGIFLVVRYHRKCKMSKSHYTAVRRVPEEIYSELENRRTVNNKFYMTLVKPEIPKNQFLYDKQRVVAGQYNLKPNTLPMNS